VPAKATGAFDIKVRETFNFAWSSTNQSGWIFAAGVCEIRVTKKLKGYLQPGFQKNYGSCTHRVFETNTV